MKESILRLGYSISGLIAATAELTGLTVLHLDKDFDLAPVPAKDAAKHALEWVSATPKSKEGSFKSVRVGFRGKELAAVEIVDAFDQRSLLQFSQFAPGVVIAPETFQFKPPPGADVVEQP